MDAATAWARFMEQPTNCRNPLCPSREKHLSFPQFLAFCPYCDECVLRTPVSKVITRWWFNFLVFSASFSSLIVLRTWPAVVLVGYFIVHAVGLSFHSKVWLTAVLFRFLFLATLLVITDMAGLTLSSVYLCIFVCGAIIVLGTSKMPKDRARFSIAVLVTMSLVFKSGVLFLEWNGVTLLNSILRLDLKQWHLAISWNSVAILTCLVACPGRSDPGDWCCSPTAISKDGGSKGRPYHLSAAGI